MDSKKAEGSFGPAEEVILGRIWWLMVSTIVEEAWIFVGLADLLQFKL